MSPLLSSWGGVSGGSENVDEEWLLANIKEVLAIVSIVGKDKVVLKFLSSVMWKDERDSLSGEGSRVLEVVHLY